MSDGEVYLLVGVIFGFGCLATLIAVVIDNVAAKKK